MYLRETYVGTPPPHVRGLPEGRRPWCGAIAPSSARTTSTPFHISSIWWWLIVVAITGLPDGRHRENGYGAGDGSETER